MKKIVIIDYKLGNLFSVKHACDFVSLNTKISSDFEDVLAADGIILPGVGAFQEGMKNLNSLGLSKAIKQKVNEGIPIFGICLGLQMLFTHSEEFGIHEGLDIISGKILKFPLSFQNIELKVPQIGWNSVFFNDLELKNKSALSVINEGDHFYFVHSFFALPNDQNHVLTITDYKGFEYCSSVFNGKNVFATQFHPEKSGEKGISVYKNWALKNNLI